jgi:hypothetical protein
MKLNFRKKLLCGFFILGSLSCGASAAPSKTFDDAAYIDEKTMELNIKKSVEFFDEAVESFNDDNLPRAKKYVDQSLALDPGNQEALDLDRKISDRMKQKNAAAPVAEKKEVVSVSSAVVSVQSAIEKKIQKSKEKAVKYYKDACRDYDKGNLLRARKNIAASLEYDAFNQDALDLSQKISVRKAGEAAALAETKRKNSTATTVVSSSVSRRWFKRAQRAYRYRDIARAVANCSAAIQADPSNSAAVLLKKRLEPLQSQLDTLKRDVVDEYRARGSLLVKEQNPLEAMWWFNRVAEIQPEDQQVDGLLLAAQEAAKNILPGISKRSDRKKIARIAACFINENYARAERIAFGLQKDYPLANVLTLTVQGHLSDVPNVERSEDGYLTAMRSAIAGHYENAFYEARQSLYFNPHNFAARCLLQQMQFEMIAPSQPDAL